MKGHVLIRSFRPSDDFSQMAVPQGDTQLSGCRLLNDYKYGLGGLGKGSQTLKIFQSKYVALRAQPTPGSLLVNHPRPIQELLVFPLSFTQHCLLERPLPRGALFRVLLEESLLSIWWGHEKEHISWGLVQCPTGQSGHWIQRRLLMKVSGGQTKPGILWRSYDVGHVVLTAGKATLGRHRAVAMGTVQGGHAHDESIWQAWTISMKQIWQTPLMAGWEKVSTKGTVLLASSSHRAKGAGCATDV